MRRTVLAIIGIGSALRLWGFVSAGPLWLDELFIATNLRQLSFAELFGPLLDGQNAPVGWLLLEKALWQFVGQGEMILRLPALIASLLSLPLTWLVTSRAVGERAALLPLALISFSPFTLWQSFQVKPYALDLCLALLLIWLAQESLVAITRPGSTPASLSFPLNALGTAGILAIWLSMPSIFVLAGIGSFFVFHALKAWRLGGDWKRLSTSIAPLFFFWVANFLVHYGLFLRPRPQPEWLYDFWSSGFLAWPPERWDIFWLPRILFHGLQDPLGLIGVAPAAALLLVAGVGAGIWRRRNGQADSRLDDLALLRVALAPIAFGILASALRLYPFSSRLILFLAPSLAILVAAASAELERLWPRGRVAFAAFTILCVATPWLITGPWTMGGGLPIAAESRALFQILEKEHRPAEPIVLGHLATYAWRQYGFDVEAQVIESKSAWLHQDRIDALEDALANAESDTAWVVLTRVRPERRGESPISAFYSSFIDRQTTWPPRQTFRLFLEADWRITLEREVYGGVLWRVERRSP